MSDFASLISVLLDVNAWVLTDFTGTRFPSAGFLTWHSNSQALMLEAAHEGSSRLAFSFWVCSAGNSCVVSEPQSSIRWNSDSTLAPKIAGQPKYIMAQLSDSRPTTVLQRTSTLISCLGLDQPVEVKLQGH